MRHCRMLGGMIFPQVSSAVATIYNQLRISRIATGVSFVESGQVSVMYLDLALIAVMFIMNWLEASLFGNLIPNTMFPSTYAVLQCS